MLVDTLVPCAKALALAVMRAPLATAA
jgi:hypothetical protein